MNVSIPHVIFLVLMITLGWFSLPAECAQPARSCPFSWGIYASDAVAGHKLPANQIITNLELPSSNRIDFYVATSEKLYINILWFHSNPGLVKIFPYPFTRLLTYCCEPREYYIEGMKNNQINLSGFMGNNSIYIIATRQPMQGFDDFIELYRSKNIKYNDLLEQELSKQIIHELNQYEKSFAEVGVLYRGTRSALTSLATSLTSDKIFMGVIKLHVI